VRGNPAAGGFHVVLKGCHLSASFMDALLRVRCVRGLKLLDCTYTSADTVPSPVPDPPLNDALEELALRHPCLSVREPGAPLDYFFQCTRLRKLEVLNEAAGAGVSLLLSSVPVKELVLDFWEYALRWHLWPSAGLL